MSGLSATGKSTHCRLLAAHYGLPYVSMRAVMSSVLNDSGDSVPGGEWTPSVDRVRAGDDQLDREADRRMLERIDNGPGVFDAWALPWLFRDSDAVRVWMGADIASRVERCLLSALGSGFRGDGDQRAMIEKKDAFSQAQFRRLYGIDFGPDPSVFDVIVENSHLLGKLSVQRAEADAAAFQAELIAAIDSVIEGDARCRPMTRGPDMATG
ncbi:MAG: AAA family ATPase [Solirubrobacterales bacterium]